jgi:itaconyl-CoA hydratase
MEHKFWEDFAVGEKVKTDSITITDAHLVNWAGLTLDFYPLHMNEEYAKRTVFGRRIAHGPFTFALSIGLVGSTGILGDSLVAWIGIENMRVPAPVMVGDTLTVDAEVIKKRETKKTENGVTIFHYTIRNQKEQCVMEFDNLFLMKRRT